jgi:hypothetical protein
VATGAGVVVVQPHDLIKEQEAPEFDLLGIQRPPQARGQGRFDAPGEPGISQDRMELRVEVVPALSQITENRKVETRKSLIF